MRRVFKTAVFVGAVIIAILFATSVFAGSDIGQFSNPGGICFDSATGYIYIVDSGNNRIVRTMMDGTGWMSFGTLGSNIGQFSNPSGICLDLATGYIYVADSGNNRMIRTKIDGTGWMSFGTLGSNIGQFNHPTALFYDASTQFIYVTDSGNSRIVRTKMDGTGWMSYGQADAPAIYGINNRAAYDMVTVTASSRFSFKVWGEVVSTAADSFNIDDGSGKPVTVVAPGFSGIQNGDHVSVSGFFSGEGPDRVLNAKATDVAKIQ